MKTDQILKLTRDNVMQLLQMRQTQPVLCENPDRRSSQRDRADGVVEIRSTRSGSCEVWQGRCENISETGLGMSCDHYFDPETIVNLTVHLDDARFVAQAVVGYCRRVRGAFMVGVEFDFS